MPCWKAPRASCKHVAALLFALEEFSRPGYARDALTCTDVLQAWNRPHRKKSEPVKACDLDWTRSGKAKRHKRTAADLEDPRALAGARLLMQPRMSYGTAIFESLAWQW